MNWSARPFVRILFFFIVGILISKYIPVIGNFNSLILLAAAIILLIWVIFVTIFHVKHKYTQLVGLLFGGLITITGILISSQNIFIDSEPQIKIESQTYLANVISIPTETKQSVKAILSVSPADSSSWLHNGTPIKILSYFAKDSLSLGLVYGDVITFRSKLTKPKGPLNPNEFNYGKYLLQSNIGYTTYINANNWQTIDYNPQNRIIAFAGKVRLSILNMLAENGLSGNNYAVAAAVLLGYDDFMENDLKQDYIMAGAMHILCVSGLHVGIIYLVINFLLGFLKSNKINNIIKTLILLFTVWAYATLTGLSPSVQRASLMITVFIFGNLLNRNRDTYNTLAISALILLVINPQLVFNVGFQLSYAAVLGIITFHEPIYKLVYIKSGFFDKIWSITVLSFSAQLATFPIAIYYFHFFPPWFWLTNLFTFPLSFMIIATGLLFVLTSWIPLIPQLVGWALGGMIYLLNYVVGFVKLLPFAGIDYIYISIPMLILIQLLITITFVMLNKKKLRLLTPVALIIALIIGFSTYNNYTMINQKKVVIYSINKHSAYDFIDGKEHILLTDSTLTNNNLDYQLKNIRTKWGIDSKVQILPTQDTIINSNLLFTDNFFLFDDIKVLITDGTQRYFPTGSKLSLDLMIISGKNIIDIKPLLTVFDISKIVIDSSVPYRNQVKISKSLKEEGIECHNVNIQGALVLEL